jgi:hypothetical protein
MNGGSSSINLKTAKGARPYRAAYAAGRCRRGDRVNRRTFISLGRGAVVAWPLAAATQEPSRTYRDGDDANGAARTIGRTELQGA